MRLRTLAGILMAGAGSLTGYALARPSIESLAAASLVWAWTAAAIHFGRLEALPRCGTCGVVEPMRLPDGSCAHCATPNRVPRPA